MQILAEKMKKEGFTEKEVEHIFYKNVFNLFTERLEYTLIELKCADKLKLEPAKCRL